MKQCNGIIVLKMDESVESDFKVEETSTVGFLHKKKRMLYVEFCIFLSN